MLTIRLQRVGKTKHPTYRIIVSEKARDTKGTFLENLGTYDPHLPKDKAFAPKVERVQYWISKGAQTSGTINNLLVDANLIKGTKAKTVYLSKKRQTKLAEKKKSAASSEVAPPAAPPAEAAPVA